jgi:hypothetical protein
MSLNRKDIREFYELPFHYDVNEQAVKDANDHIVVSIKGYGFLSNLTDNDTVCGAQDKLGEEITEMLNKDPDAPSLEEECAKYKEELSKYQNIDEVSAKGVHDIWEEIAEIEGETIYYRYSWNKIPLFCQSGYFIGNKSIGDLCLPLVDLSMVGPKLLKVVSEDYSKRNQDGPSVDGTVS